MILKTKATFTNLEIIIHKDFFKFFVLLILNIKILNLNLLTIIY